MTRKEYRNYLNNLHGVNRDGKGANGKYKARSREYGDYLWFQDRDMFEASYQEHIQN
jgi:hypothetical protein